MFWKLEKFTAREMKYLKLLGCKIGKEGIKRRRKINDGKEVMMGNDMAEKGQ